MDRFASRRRAAPAETTVSAGLDDAIDKIAGKTPDKDIVVPILAAVAATFSVGQLLSADPPMGNAMELDAIAAVVIGGASLFGGRGSMFGTPIGVFIQVMIRNALNLIGVSPFWQGTGIGTIIIVAVLVERLGAPLMAASEPDAEDTSRCMC